LPTKKFISTPLLRERGLGLFEGKSAAELGYDDNFEEEYYAKDPKDYISMAVEPMDVMFKRLNQLIGIIKLHSPKKLLIVGHGTINSYLASQLLGETEKTRKFKPQANDSINYLRLDAGGNEYLLDWQPK
jgi:broad specificity phosphatase PhoE